MSDLKPSTTDRPQVNGSDWESGGLRFKVYFRPERGCTAEIYGQINGDWKELLRFDDFVEGPHFHVPADGQQIEFDRSLGEPLAWYVDQIASRLEDMLTEGGFAELLPSLDLRLANENAQRVNDAMVACIPPGPGALVRVPGYGLKSADS